ncbi:MAG: nucleotidyltransferase domain-containing protein [Burkholderiaceae bacterium]|nr:nucleotidyltransferase domain-containing protein [Burkholderiaceae bacterium]MDP3131709.1 nucleotidyltransferase domain-containing protein [Burkholderiaceae bacterium]
MPTTYAPVHDTLRTLLESAPGLLFAVLVGSRAQGTAHMQSDWDIALQWDYSLPWLEVLGRTETLRRQLASALQVPEDAVDLIELRRANLAMKATVAEDGLALCGEDSLEWARFLRRTWRELEDFYWDKAHA